MRPIFDLGKNIYFIMGFILLIGLFLIVIKSDYMLDYGDFNINLGQESKVVHTVKVSDNIRNDQAKYLIISDKKDTIESKYGEVFANTLNQLKKEYELKDLSEKIYDYASYQGIIIATEELSKIKNFEYLMDYVESGGSLFFAVRPSPSSTLTAIYQKIGIVELGNFIETTGIDMEMPLLTTGGPTSFDSPSLRNSSLSIRLNEESDVLAKSSEGLPLLWEKMLGNGKIVLFNGSMLNEYSNRALFIKGLSVMTDDFIYPIMNAKITAIEGFPFPIPKGLAAPIKNSERLSTREFYRNQWWLEMQRLEAKYDLNYTASYVVSYDKKFVQFKPEIFSDNQEELKSFGKELIKMGGELAVRSYTDRPLSKENPINAKEMIDDLNKRVEDALPGYPIRSLIAPDPEFQMKDYEEVLGNMPEIKTILANTDTFQIKENIVILPKTVFGYELNNRSEWLIQNELYASGYYAQTVTPQYFLNTGTSFDESMRAFGKTQESIETYASWLTETTLTDIYLKAESFIKTKIIEEKTDKGLKIYSSNFSEGQSFLFKTTKQIKYTTNCEVKKIAKNLYFIEAENANFEIGLEGL